MLSIDMINDEGIIHGVRSHAHEYSNELEHIPAIYHLRVIVFTDIYINIKLNTHISSM